jgi:nitroreductase
MEFSKLMEQRQSCRTYDKEKEISKTDIDLILRAGWLSPSAKNSQPWRFYAAAGDKKREVVKACQDMGMNAFLNDVSLMVVIIKEKPTAVGAVTQRVYKDFRPYDIGIATANMVMQAKDLGVESCIIGWINDAKMRDALGVDKKEEIALAIAFGYPAEGYQIRNKKRKDKEAVIKYL